MVKATKPLSILVVEDNEGDFVLVEEFLLDEFEQPKVVHASRFSEAENLLKSAPNTFDTVLLDLTLPDKSGESLVEEMLNIVADIPVIILTGYTDLEFSVLSLSKGVSDYLLKDDLSPTLLKKSILYGIERNSFSLKIRQSEKNYRDLFELSPEPMMLFDLNTYEFLDVNQATVNSYGYSKQELLSMTLMDIKPDDEKEGAKRIIQETKNNANITLEGEHRHVKKNGDIILVEIRASSLQYKGKNVRIALARDVTEKRIEEERLKLLESVITNTNETVVILEAEPSEYPTRKILYVNNAFTKTSGYSKEEVINKPLSFLYGEKTDSYKVKNVMRRMNQWEACTVELVNYKKNGEPFWNDTSFVPVKGEDDYTHWIAISRDVTEKVKNEREIKSSLAEKELLLSEIHHRVKNNLAVVSGMMQLQTFEEENELVQEKLNDSILRIQTMASIHEILYRSSSFSHLYFSDVVDQLVHKIDSVVHKGQKIDLNIKKTFIELNINQAIPSSLILNEILTNVYKHAFVGRDKGKIDVEMNLNNEEVTIKVMDDGVGIESSEKKEKNLGLQIVEILTEQLDGKHKLYDTGNGTTFELVFNKREVKGTGSAFI